MKNVKFLSLLILGMILSCGKSEVEPDLINPSEANAVSKIVITPSGGETKQGTPPSPSSTQGVLTLTTQADPTVNAVQNGPSAQVISAAQGTTINLNCYYVCNINNCVSIRANLKNSGTPYCIYRIKGSDSYKIYPYPNRFGSSGSLNFPFTLPDNIGNGSFDVEFSIVDEYGLVTNYNNTRVDVKRLADADNPAKAYGCDFSKSSSELQKYLDIYINNPTTSNCQNFKVKYNSLVQAMLKCSQIPQSSKDQLKLVNDQLQSSGC